MRLTGTSHRATQLELYRAATDALTTASRYHDRQAPGSDPYWSLGSLRHLVVAFDATLDSAGKTLVERARSGELTTVEGPFIDDAITAAVTAQQWLERARSGLQLGVVQPLESAHITIAGIART